MPVKIEIKGNFLKTSDLVSKDQYIGVDASKASYIRDSLDNFAFMNNAQVLNSYGSTEVNKLGRTETLDPITDNGAKQAYTYPASEIVDSNGIAIGGPGGQWTDIDDFEDWLSNNLSKPPESDALKFVTTDATLTGNGTFANPLSVVPIPAPSIGFYAQTVRSTTITNTTTESSIVGSGVGTLSIPADTFIVGDSFHAKIGGIMSAQNGDEITIRIKTGSIVLASTGLITLEPVTNLGWEIELDFTVTKIGAIGEISTNGNFAYNRNTGSLEGFVFQDVQNIDTTIANTLDITVQWNQAKAADEIYSSNFVLYKVY